MWLIHIDVWQKPTQYCKAIILQLKMNFSKKCLGLPKGHSGKESTCQRRRPRGAAIQVLGREDPLKWEMATHSSILARKWTEELGGPQFMGSQIVEHN